MVPSICKSYQSTWVCSTAIHKTSIPGLRSLAYIKRCARLGINRLEFRRLHADLTLCYKIIHGLDLLSCDRFFTIVYGHKFVTYRQTTPLHKFPLCGGNLTTWQLVTLINHLCLSYNTRPFAQTICYVSVWLIVVIDHSCSCDWCMELTT